MQEKQKTESSYILETGGQGAINLDLQHEIFKQESFAQLKKAGLAKNMVIWDIGCGSGTMTEYLAQIVGREGLIYAVDISEDQIKTAKNRIESAGYKNVQFIVGDINSLDISKYKKADLVYSRFLLMHVTDPKKVIKIMTSLLKPRGIISLQESSMDSIKESGNPDIHKYYNLIISYGKPKGFDYTIGRKLEKICSDLGVFSKVLGFKRNYKTSDDIKKILSVRLDELENKFLSSNLITKEEYTTLKTNVRNFLKDKKSNDVVVMCEQSHILAYK